ncbi:uncharacterized protein [Manis javanica]|uniref:uncharacterized protein isoform X1 n=1 Tax=Manis javanica TaxID=9974 RepID=UPI001879CE59|nr:vegetative cell wall protein gp1-like isoform X1 [Manis javanica]
MHQPLSFLLVLKPVLGNWMHGRLRQPTPPAAHAHPRRLSPLTQLPTCRQQPRMSLSARPTQTPTVPAALAAEAPRSPAKPQTPRQPDPEVATRFRYPPLPPSAKTQPPACTRPPRPPADAAVARQSPAPSNTKAGRDTKHHSMLPPAAPAPPSAEAQTPAATRPRAHLPPVPDRRFLLLTPAPASCRHRCPPMPSPADRAFAASTKANRRPVPATSGSCHRQQGPLCQGPGSLIPTHASSLTVDSAHRSLHPIHRDSALASSALPRSTSHKPSSEELGKEVLPGGKRERTGPTN